VKQKLDDLKLKDVKLEQTDIKKELLSGEYTKGGSITVVLDMSVTDNEEWAVQHGLKMLRRYNNPHFDKCNETEKKIDARVKTVHCYMCGKIFIDNVLQVNKFTRFPDWGYEVGVELVMDILVREEEHEMAQLMNNLSFDRKYSQGLQWLNKRLTGLRKMLETKGDSKGVTGDKSAKGSLTPLPGFGDDDEEEDSGPMSDPDGRVGMPDNIKKRIQQELDRQGAFQKKLRYLRQELENAHFAKPVCARCFEAARSYNDEGTPRIYAIAQDVMDPNKPRPDPIKTPYAPDDNRFTFNWRAIRNLTDKAYSWAYEAAMNDKDISDHQFDNHPEMCKPDRNLAYTSKEWPLGIPVTAQGADMTGNPGVGKNAMTLVRGGWYGEFEDTAFQCAGRVNCDLPGADDEDEFPRDSFCDVRFDRIPKGSKKPPEKVTCYATGKIFCSGCCKSPATIKEFELDPSAPKEGTGPILHLADTQRHDSAHACFSDMKAYITFHFD